MTEDDTIERRGNFSRRKFIAGVSAGAAAGLAGCTGGGDGGTTTKTTTAGTTETTTTTTTKEKIPEGGKPILGMSTAPNNLNPLASSTAYTWTILDNIYTFGTTSNPKTGRPEPWAFKDWTVNVDNVGTDKPTITANLQEGLTFSDGEDLTADDVKFTVEYIKEQKPAGTISASQFSSVEKVETNGDYTVEYYLKEKDRAWLTAIVGNIILPKHIWSDVDDYSKYTPRKEGGPIGAGPFTLEDYKWESWFELKPREGTPWNQLEGKDWLHDKGPFIDTLRIEVFGSNSALNKAVLNGDVDQSYGGLKVEKAAEATKKDHLKVLKSKDDGWSHHSYNLRRVPLDDKVFRQFLNKMLDEKWVVEKLFKGLGAEYGDYATPKAYSGWRPPVPSETGGEYEGISIPNTEFPGERGAFQLDQSSIDAARKYLVDNPDAKHDYTIGDSKSDKVKSPDGKAIYVNGKPIEEAHTDNDGNAGQGPIEMSYNPPSSSPKTARLASNWVTALRKVGIPISEAVQSFNSQIPKVYSKENYDMFEMGWTGIGWNNDHYKSLYGKWGADLDGTSEASNFNPMAYTGADDLIKKQAQMMDVKPRQPIVKKVLAQIFHDAPTLITKYSRVLQPVTTKFSGRVKQVGGVTNADTWLNIRLNPEEQ